MRRLDRLARALVAREDRVPTVAPGADGWSGPDLSRRQLMAVAATGAVGVTAVTSASAGLAPSCIGADPVCLGEAERAYADASATCATTAQHRHGSLWTELRCQIAALNDHIAARAACRGPRDALCPTGQHCTSRGTCLDDSATPGAVPCDACTDCQAITIGATPPDGSLPPVTISPCAGGCAPADLCRGANADSDYPTLAAALAADGLKPDASARVYQLFQTTTLLRTLLAVRYSDPHDSARASELLYLVEAPSGSAQASVIEMQAGKVIAGLEVNAAGVVERVLPDLAAFQPPPPLQAVAANLGSTMAHMALTSTECAIMCNAACDIALGIGLGVVGTLICDGAGLLCAAVIGGTLAADTFVICFATCDQGFCKPKQYQYQCVATSANSKCPAVGQVYPSAAACSGPCQAGLSCFVGTMCVPIG